MEKIWIFHPVFICGLIFLGNRLHNLVTTLCHIVVSVLLGKHQYPYQIQDNFDLLWCIQGLAHLGMKRQLSLFTD